MIKDKISKLLFVLLTIVGISPFFVYLFQASSKQEINLRNPISIFLIQPKALVYSSDYFFTKEKIFVTLLNGQMNEFPWKQIVPKEYSDNFLYYIYLRHVFNMYKPNNTDLKNDVKVGIKNFICTASPDISSVNISYFAPFTEDKILLSISEKCHE